MDAQKCTLITAMTCLFAGTGAFAQNEAESDLDLLLQEEQAAAQSSEMAEQPADQNTSNNEQVSNEAKVTPVEDKPRSRGNRLMVEEIVVTAQKREQDIKDVPISIQSFNEEQLDALQIRDVRDLPKITPGLNITSQISFTSTFLRGVGSDAFVLGDPQVVTYIDNVYYPFGSGQNGDFGNVESIEVLKGPQGTLFGRNALGGAIMVQTKKPVLEEFASSISASYGTNDNQKLKAFVSVPLGDTLAFSLSGIKKERENHLHGLHTPNLVPLPLEEQESFRIKGLWAAADWMEVNVGYYDMLQEGALFAANTRPSLLATTAGIQPSPRRGGKHNESVPLMSEIQALHGDVTFNTPWLDLKLLASDQEVLTVQDYDFDGSEMPIARFASRPSFSDTSTYELQLLSNESTPWSDWLSWIAGIYYYDGRAGFDPATFTGAATDLEVGTFAGVPLPQESLNLLTSLLGGAPFPVGATINITGILVTESLAYFSQLDFDITEWLSMSLGARYQIEERIIETSRSAVRNLDGSETVYLNFSCSSDPQYCDTTHSFDPRVSLNFRPGWQWLGNDPLIYANYQTATTSATFNSINIFDSPERVESTEIEAWEIGYKTELLDGLVDFNAAAFYYDLINPQVQVVSLAGSGAVRFETAQSQKIKGLEFDTVMQILPSLTGGGLIMTMTGSYLDAIYTEYTNGSGFNDQTGLYEENQDYSGNPIVRTPKYSATVGLLQTFDTHYGPFEVGLDYYYNDGFSYLAQGGDMYSEPSYGTLGANLSYLYEPWQLRVSLFGRNLLDEDYNAAAFPNDFGIADSPAPLTTYGMILNWEY